MENANEYRQRYIQIYGMTKKDIRRRRVRGGFKDHSFYYLTGEPTIPRCAFKRLWSFVAVRQQWFTSNNI